MTTRNAAPFVTPRVLVSACLGFEACRWNKAVVRSPFVDALRDHADCVTVCPEREIGLGVPRDPVHVEERRGLRTLVQPATGRDCTAAMREFAAAFLARLGPLDGAVLKARSPSCGIKDVKIRTADGASVVTGKGIGFFGGAVLDAHPDLPVEDEGRMTNARLREHFLTRLFAQARLRAAAARPAMKTIVAFHAAHKYLLMAYGQTSLRGLGRIVANHEKRPTPDVFADYAARFARALDHPPRVPAAINALQHMYGYVSSELNAAEKRLFDRALTEYRQNRYGAIVLLQLIKSWVARFDVAYLADQVILEPFPAALVSPADSASGKGTR